MEEKWVPGPEFTFKTPNKRQIVLAGGNVRSPINTRRRTTMALGHHTGPLISQGDLDETLPTKLAPKSFYKSNTASTTEQPSDGIDEAAAAAASIPASLNGKTNAYSTKSGSSHSSSVEIIEKHAFSKDMTKTFSSKKVPPLKKTSKPASKQAVNTSRKLSPILTRRLTRRQSVLMSKEKVKCLIAEVSNTSLAPNVDQVSSKMPSSQRQQKGAIISPKNLRQRRKLDHTRTDNKLDKTATRPSKKPKTSSADLNIKPSTIELDENDRKIVIAESSEAATHISTVVVSASCGDMKLAPALANSANTCLPLTPTQAAPTPVPAKSNSSNTSRSLVKLSSEGTAKKLATKRRKSIASMVAKQPPTKKAFSKDILDVPRSSPARRSVPSPTAIADMVNESCESVIKPAPEFILDTPDIQQHDSTSSPSQRITPGKSTLGKSTLKRKTESSKKCLSAEKTTPARKAPSTKKTTPAKKLLPTENIASNQNLSITTLKTTSTKKPLPADKPTPNPRRLPATRKLTPNRNMVPAKNMTPALKTPSKNLTPAKKLSTARTPTPSRLTRSLRKMTELENSIFMTPDTHLELQQGDGTPYHTPLVDSVNSSSCIKDVCQTAEPESEESVLNETALSEVSGSGDFASGEAGKSWCSVM